MSYDVARDEEMQHMSYDVARDEEMQHEL